MSELRLLALSLWKNFCLCKLLFTVTEHIHLPVAHRTHACLHVAHGTHMKLLVAHRKQVNLRLDHDIFDFKAMILTFKLNVSEFKKGKFVHFRVSLLGSQFDPLRILCSCHLIYSGAIFLE